MDKELIIYFPISSQPEDNVYPSRYFPFPLISTLLPLFEGGGLRWG